ncbi:MAG: citrate lyase ligase [Holophaga sp.]|jgi:[citrate (pro-3S)-lyase] ligase
MPSGPLLFDRPARTEARDLIVALGLRFEPDYDDLAGLYDGDRLVACGARAGYVLKMLAIAPGYQGGEALGALATPLVQSALAAGHDTVFVFTTPGNASSFEALNFRLLAAYGKAALLEHGPGLEVYLEAQARLVTPGANGAVVANANPFTLGHLHLVESAARQVDRLYLFVVREDRSAFPFPVRFRLAQEATAHLANVTVLDTSRYAVSAATFPSYFLKRLDEAAQAQMGIDLELFARRLAPPFHIVHRFAGREPLDPTTAAYNRKMAEILPAHGIRWTELPRAEAAGGPISASRVRAALKAGETGPLKALLPPCTLDFLGSPQAVPVIERLRAATEGA